MPGPDAYKVSRQRRLSRIGLGTGGAEISLCTLSHGGRGVRLVAGCMCVSQWDFPFWYDRALVHWQCMLDNCNERAGDGSGPRLGRLL